MPEFLNAFLQRFLREFFSERTVVAGLWAAAVVGLSYVGFTQSDAVILSDLPVESAADGVAEEVSQSDYYEQRRENLREQYPVVSLEERLSYEHQRAETIFASIVRSVEPQSGFDSIELAPDVDERLTRLEETIGTHWLASVHSDEEIAEGEIPMFGMLRMPFVFESLPVKQPELPSDESSYIHIDGFAARVEPPTKTAAGEQVPRKFLDVNATAERGDTYLKLHEQGRSQFLSPSSFGFVPERKEAAGFRRHSISRMIRSGVSDLGEDWQIVRLDLVSLLKFDEARVYVSEYLPDMSALDDVETRPVDDFEAVALRQLASEKDVVIQESHGVIRMLGSLRAAKQCLDCHDVNRGELLGAFTYRLRPASKASDQASVALAD